MNKLKNVPKDIENSLEKFNKLIEIIESNIHKPHEVIEREIIINLNISIKGARNLFNKFYPLDFSFYEYILERKRSETIKSIIDIDDDVLINRNIKKIANKDKKYFNKMLYKDYKVRINDLKNNKNIKLNLLEAFDIKDLQKNIISIYDSLDYMSKIGYVDIKRTKVKINDISKYI